MANQAGVRVEGLRETIRSLERFGVEVSDLKTAFKKIGNIVVDEAKTLAPKKSGALAASIKPSNTKNKSIVRAGSARVVYAGVIHYGGYHGIEPHPFLTDAVTNNAGKAKETMEQELTALIHKLNLNP